MRAGFHKKTIKGGGAMQYTWSQSLVNEGRFPQVLGPRFKFKVKAGQGRNPSLMRAGFHRDGEKD